MGFRVQGAGCIRFRVWGGFGCIGFRVRGVGFRQGLGLRVYRSYRAYKL